MDWLTVLMITFSAVSANHLGLVAAAESVVRHRLPVLNCPKCAVFWAVLAYGITTVPCGFPQGFITTLPSVFSVAFLSAWSAIWLDLLMGIIDHIYLKVYDSIYPTTNPADTDT